MGRRRSWTRRLTGRSGSEGMTAEDGTRRVARGVAWAGICLVIFSGWFAVTRLVLTTADLRIWDVVLLRFGGVGRCCCRRCCWGRAAD